MCSYVGFKAQTVLSFLIPSLHPSLPLFSFLVSILGVLEPGKR